MLVWEEDMVKALREENARLSCAAAGLKQCCEEQRAEVSRLEGLNDVAERKLGEIRDTLAALTPERDEARAAIKNPSPGGPALTGGTPDGVTGVSPESPACFHCGYRRENVLAPEVK